MQSGDATWKYVESEVGEACKKFLCRRVFSPYLGITLLLPSMPQTFAFKCFNPDTGTTAVIPIVSSECWPKAESFVLSFKLKVTIHALWP